MLDTAAWMETLTHPAPSDLYSISTSQPASSFWNATVAIGMLCILPTPPPLPYLDGLGEAGFYCLAWLMPERKQRFSLAFISATGTGLSISHTWILKVLVWVNHSHQQCIFSQRRKVHNLLWDSDYLPLGQA